MDYRFISSKETLDNPSPELSEHTQMQNKKLNYKYSYIAISFVFGFSTISELAILYFLKDVLQIAPANMSVFTSFILIPWSIKPLFGFITDLFPIWGLRRKPYIILCGLVAWTGWSYLYLFYEELGLFSTFIILFMISCSMSFCTVLAEALVVELSLMDEVNSENEVKRISTQENELNPQEQKNQNNIANNDNSKDYVSNFFLFKNCGLLLASFLKGFFCS